MICYVIETIAICSDCSQECESGGQLVNCVYCECQSFVSEGRVVRMGNQMPLSGVRITSSIDRNIIFNVSSNSGR